jgi:TonB family protein
MSTGGGGIDFSLAGRNPVSLPKPEYNSQVSGTIVVRIRVNREGKVTSAEPGARGTNIADKTLWESAKKAALKARFNAKADATLTQAGTITYHFVLQ